MQYVFEFCAQKPEPMIEAIRRVLGATEYTTEHLAKAEDTFRPVNIPLDSTAEKLNSGQIRAFSLRPSVGPNRYFLVLAPNYDGPNLSFYLGTIESISDDYHSIWQMLLEVPGLTLVCLGLDEGVELDDSSLTTDTFPWNDWPLIIGAVRGDPDSKDWVIRSGPEMTQLNNAGRVEHP